MRTKLNEKEKKQIAKEFESFKNSKFNTDSVIKKEKKSLLKQQKVLW